MDMEVIQEFSENQCYLNALSQLNKQKPVSEHFPCPCLFRHIAKS